MMGCVGPVSGPCRAPPHHNRDENSGFCPNSRSVAHFVEHWTPAEQMDVIYRLGDGICPSVEADFPLPCLLSVLTIPAVSEAER